MPNAIMDSKDVIPKYIGIIPDGNRRWAKQNNIELAEAYWLAMQKIASCLVTLFKRGASSVCVYLLSKDNVLRARDDLDAVITAEIRLLRELIPPLRTTYLLRTYHAGNPSLLSPEYVAALNEICESGNGRGDPFPRLYLCAGYDPYEEIEQCCNDITLTPRRLIETLSVPLELDAVIRTGGDIRISGFLPLQSKYAEFFFEPYYFPDISEDRITAIIDEFKFRGRRFGK
ncbi:MAG: undecaprenyl diphosphate synthase family protein [Chloroflexi bacterium]|nr:undecaprenyl diphosphate synthase family protein [Chloroflexota bacterium]